MAKKRGKKYPLAQNCVKNCVFYALGEGRKTDKQPRVCAE